MENCQFKPFFAFWKGLIYSISSQKDWLDQVESTYNVAEDIFDHSEVIWGQ